MLGCETQGSHHHHRGGQSAAGPLRKLCPDGVRRGKTWLMTHMARR
jgi:hypothetical protein